jgi:hypothetical protein
LTAALVAAAILSTGAAASADTAYFTYNGEESGDMVRSLNDSVTGTLREYSVLGLAPGQEDYFASPNATFYSKAFPDGNAVAAGDWVMDAWGKAVNPSKVIFSPEIGEYRSDGTYRIIVPHGDLPDGFGWTPEYIGGNYTLRSVTKAAVPAFTLDPGSRLYVRVWVRNIHSTQIRDGWLATDTTANNSRMSTPPFAVAIPALGWWLVILLTAGFMTFALSRGVLKLRKVEA